jgi:hypothetical protein
MNSEISKSNIEHFLEVRSLLRSLAFGFHLVVGALQNADILEI